ncbi:MAG: ATP-dependent DNA helicase RecG [Nitrospirae bacterium]|nr:ATP-dependent DNA helicase RecG [Nitrospirota bacterium]
MIAAPNREPVLQRPVRYVKGVGPKIGAALEAAGIRTLEDLVCFFPRTYEDRRSVTTFRNIRPGETVTTTGRVVGSRLRLTAGRRQLLEVTLTDGTGHLTCRWFHFRAGYERLFRAGFRVVLTGTAQAYRGQMEILHPEVEWLPEAGPGPQVPATTSLHYGRIVPVYSEIGGIPTRRLRTILRAALDLAKTELRSALPPTLQREAPMPLPQAVEETHFPPPDRNPQILFARRTPAQERIILEEFFLLSLGLLLRRRASDAAAGHAMTKPGGRGDLLRKALDFSLTGAQERALAEILTDLARPRPMNRLLQGDVGSGKTIVAFLAALRAADNDFQTAFMAPTEILAEQHHRTLGTWAEKTNTQVALLTSGTSTVERQEILEAARSGEVHTLIGTHALIEKAVAFNRLGLIVVDEQHRFGVAQRAELLRKGVQPHVLIMSATPIPRTLAMTLYGDLDVSTLDEMPPGRKPIVTRIVPDGRRARFYTFVNDEVGKGRQAFLVYPLVEDSEKVYLKNAKQMAEEFRTRIFPHLKVGLMHGRMKAEEKDAVMRSFRDGAIQILVATTVIEVGIDVPNATLMVVEHAERFGLAQLHQLRGRVGRGAESSTCLLIVGKEAGPEAAQRLKAMVETQDGFRIAEEDLRIRGPGEFLGLRQSGYPDFHLGNLIEDTALLRRSQEWARRVLATDPALARPEHRFTRERLVARWHGRLELGSIA